MLLDQPGIVLKRELLYIPFYGWYLWRAAAIPIDREGGGNALRRMVRDSKQTLVENRSILIFPEGTRQKPGAPPDYKPGVAALYGQLGVPCVPVALNSGLYWQGFIKKPGTILLEFLEPIPAGMRRRELLPGAAGAADRDRHRRAFALIFQALAWVASRATMPIYKSGEPRSGMVVTSP